MGESKLILRIMYGFYSSYRTGGDIQLLCEYPYRYRSYKDLPKYEFLFFNIKYKIIRNESHN